MGLLKSYHTGFLVFRNDCCMFLFRRDRGYKSCTICFSAIYPELACKYKKIHQVWTSKI